MTDRELAQLKSLDVNTQIEQAAEYLGYKSLPPTIDKFVTKPYYLGKVCENLYPFWREKLKEMFPTCIHNKYPVVIFTGAIGCGKIHFFRPRK